MEKSNKLGLLKSGKGEGKKPSLEGNMRKKLVFSKEKTKKKTLVTRGKRLKLFCKRDKLSKP